MKLILFLIVIFLAVGCQQNIGYELSKDEKLANEITSRVAAKLKKEMGLRPCGTNGQMMNKIKVLGLSFNYYKPISIEEGRELLITAVDEFVKAVNEDERIRPYLNNYPFESKNIDIEIFLHNPNGSDVTAGNLRVISSVGGILEYDIRDPKTNRLTTIYKETYEEAVSKMDTTVAKSA
jgi:hypothetical protein